MMMMMMMIVPVPDDSAAAVAVDAVGAARPALWRGGRCQVERRADVLAEERRHSSASREIPGARSQCLLAYSF